MKIVDFGCPALYPYRSCNNRKNKFEGPPSESETWWNAGAGSRQLDGNAMVHAMDSNKPGRVIGGSIQFGDLVGNGQQKKKTQNVWDPSAQNCTGMAPL